MGDRKPVPVILVGTFYLTDWCRQDLVEMIVVGITKGDTCLLCPSTISLGLHLFSSQQRSTLPTRGESRAALGTSLGHLQLCRQDSKALGKPASLGIFWLSMTQCFPNQYFISSLPLFFLMEGVRLGDSPATVSSL